MQSTDVTADARAAKAMAAVIDGQFVNVRSETTAIAAMTSRLRRGHGFTLFTLNLDHLVKRRDDARFRAVYQRATLVTADGAPIVWLARRQAAEGAPPIRRTTGADLMEPMLAAAAREEFPVFLFGASEASLTAAVSVIRARHPTLKIAGMEAPPLGFDPTSLAADAAIQRIRASGARLVFIALGAPKQEFFADRLHTAAPEIGCLAIGAGIDFISGVQRRAPSLWRRLGLEWGWRLLQDPRRMTLRYGRCALLMLSLLARSPSNLKLFRASNA
jgi:exopolysaccharide biosynthesis WecB/TagA/CpsF family protein